VAFSPFSPSSRQPPFPGFHLAKIIEERERERSSLLLFCCIPEKAVKVAGAYGILHKMLAFTR